MSLTLITGRANAGKTGEIHTRLLASLAAGQSPVLLLPTRPDVRRATAEFSLRAPVGLRIATLDTWTAELWRLYGDGRRVVGRAAREALVERAVAEASERVELPWRSPGVSRLVATALSTSGGFDPGSPAGQQPELQGIRDIASAYWELLEASGLIEHVQALELLADSEIPGLGFVGVNRFVDIADPYVGFLLGLARSADVGIALTWEQGFTATAALDETIERAEQAGATHVRMLAEDPLTELDRVETQLYQGASPLDPDGHVVFAEAAGGLAECALVAEGVADEIAAGTEPGRIVVAFPDVAARHGAMEAALRARGIPYEMDFAQPLDDTPFGRSLCALIDVASGTGGREEALAFLLGPYSDAEPGAVAALDVEWRRRRVGSGPRLIASVEGLGGATGAIMATTRLAVQRTIAPTELAKWQELTFNLFANARKSAGLESLHAAVDAAALRQFVGVLEEMASVADAPFGARDLRRALGAARVSTVSTESAQHVQVTEARRIRSRRFDVVVLGGLTARETPVDARDSLADEVRRALGGRAGRGGDLDRLLFYATATRARTRLVLVRQIADEAGAPLRASVLWDEMLDLYRIWNAEGEAVLPDGVEIRRTSAAEIATYLPTFTQGRSRVREAAMAAGYSGPARGALTSVTAREALEGRGPFRVTEIETYLQCPYRWFYDRVVRPRDIDTSIDAREIGTRAHNILAEFYRRLREDTSGDRVTADLLAEVLPLIDAAAGAVASRRPSPADLAEEYAVQAAASRARRIIEDDASLLPGFSPLVEEWRFGPGTDTPFEFGGVELTGTADRIDASDQSLVVMDYKSASKIHGHEEFEREGLVQAVVYAAAAERGFGKPVAASVYRSLRTHAMRGFWVPLRLEAGLEHGDDRDAIEPQGLAELMERVGGRVAQAAEGMRAGSIPREPRVPGVCAFCPISAGCDRGEPS